MALAFLVGAAGAATAGEAELALLQSFMGSYNGKGHLVEPDKTTDFDCRLTISKGNKGKIVFNGKCPLVAGNGGIAFNEAQARFEIAMTSSADFSGSAAGTQSGDAVHFTIVHNSTNKKGETLDITAKMMLTSQAVEIRFDATFTGKPWTGSLLFARSGG